MKTHLEGIHEILTKNLRPEVNFKADGSAVTALDLALTDFIEEKLTEDFHQHIFYSEEKYSAWGFPLIALDPLDGTREFIAGRNEWAISIGYFPKARWEGEGWVYNPQRRECFDRAINRTFQAKQVYRGEASRSECEQGFYEGAPGHLSITPMGSIAYKLGRLSAGKVDFIVSLKPKNIWDIAGGTLLCQQAGLKFYSEGKEVDEVRPSYEPPLFWCHEELFPELSKAFSVPRKRP